MSAIPVLEVRGAVKSYGAVRALRGVDLTLHREEVLALLGDNGAGKSTLIKAVSGVLTLDAGRILVDGVDLPAPRVGDLLAVPVTGAYCFTMANNYNGNRRLPVVFAADGRSREVVRRETWDDLIARDLGD